jgi:branched-chain amino acid aminotransferase
MARGTHDTLEDPRNAEVLIYLNGQLVPRDEAKVSVFDSGFTLGDGVWEGLRLHNGRYAFLDLHLDRLFEGAKAINMDIGMSREELAAALYRTAEANGMTGGVHARLMVTRGPKKTPFQDPRLSLWGPTVVIVAEHKEADPETFEQGIRLFTAHVHRGPPDVQDPKLNSHSKLNCIVAMIQAIKAGADEALMLDPQGFISTCNSTNFFIVRRGEVWTSTGNYCMNGITRAKVVALCRANAIPVFLIGRGLRRRGGLRHRELWRPDAGRRDRRPDHRHGRTRTRRPAYPRTLPGAPRDRVPTGACR